MADEDAPRGMTVEELGDFLLANCPDDPEGRARWDAMEPCRRLGRQLMIARRSAQMTIEELSERTGMAIQELDRIHMGEVAADWSTIDRICVALGLQGARLDLPDEAA